jgi:hypothetical protein
MIMKRINFLVFISAFFLVAFTGVRSLAQDECDNTVRIKVRKKIDGKKYAEIDTMLCCPVLAIMSFHNCPDPEMMDSLQKEIDEFMKAFHEKHQERMERMQECMKEIKPELEMLCDSMHKYKMKLVVPGMHLLDSLENCDWHSHYFCLDSMGVRCLRDHLKMVDTLHRKIIIGLDSFDIEEFDIDIEMDIDLDSLLDSYRKSIMKLNCPDIFRILDDCGNDESFPDGILESHWNLTEDAICMENSPAPRLEYKNDKVLVVKEDASGRVTKVVILNSDGEIFDVIKGEDARNYLSSGKAMTLV